MVSLPNTMKGDVYMKSTGNTRRVFIGYGRLKSIDFSTYVGDLINCVYEDDVDGYLIVCNELTGELRYIERDER